MSGFTNITVENLSMMDIASEGESESSSELNCSNVNDNNIEANKCFVSDRLNPVEDTRLQAFIFILYLVTSILSVLGNAVVLLVAAFGCQKFFSYVSSGQSTFPHSSSSSRSIRRYLANLAVSDITLALMSMPFMYSNVVLGYWNYPHFLCPVAQFAQLLTSFTTSSTLTIIGIERYIVTLHPLSCASSWLKSHANWLLGFSWILGSIYAYMPIVHTYVKEFELNEQEEEVVEEGEVEAGYKQLVRSNTTTIYYQCSYQNDISDVKLRAIVLINFLFTFLLPLVLITAAYAAIIRRLKRRRRLLQLQKMNNGGLMKRSFSAFISNKQQQQAQQQQQLQQRSSDLSATSTSTGFCRASGGGTPAAPATAIGVTGRNDVSGGVVMVCCNFSANRDAGTTSTFSSSLPIERQTKTIKMIFTVILLYCICLLPFKTLQLLLNFKLISYCSEEEFTVLVTVYITFHWMAMANSFVNPIIYSYMSRSFRSDFAKMLAHFGRKWNGQNSRQDTNADGVAAAGRWS